MKINKFWKNYKNKSELEKRAIKSIETSMKFLFDNVAKEKIISLYLKGTFVTREMNEKSDVDIVPILKDDPTLKKLQKLRDANKEFLKPSELLPISLIELKTNKNTKHRGKLKGLPDTFLRDIEHYKLVYGKKLEKKNFPMRTSEEMFKQEIKTLLNQTIPLYKEGKYGFQQLIKQVFWLSYHEQKLKGKNPPRTWKALNSFIKDKKHIIHKTYHFRLHHTKNKRKRELFVKSLINYLGKIKSP